MWRNSPQRAACRRIITPARTYGRTTTFSVSSRTASTWESRHSAKAASRKHYGSGRHVPVQNAPDRIMSRPMPHLACVSALLWQQANDSVTKRDRAESHPKGRNNRCYRKPRNSRGPLSGHFICGICGGKMIAQGRQKDGGYRCGNALRGACWNRATCFQSSVHERILAAVGQKFQCLGGATELLVAMCQDLHRTDGGMSERIKRLRQEISQFEREAMVCAKKCIEFPDSEAYEQIRAEKENSLRTARTGLQALEAQVGDVKDPLTCEQIIEKAKTAMENLNGEEVWPLVRCLTTPIQAVPFHRIDCNLVVLRRGSGSTLYVCCLTNGRSSFAAPKSPSLQTRSSPKKSRSTSLSTLARSSTPRKPYRCAVRPLGSRKSHDDSARLPGQPTMQSSWPR